MTDDENARPSGYQSERTSAQTIARQNRLRDALRENLKRRKSQSRGRADLATEDPGSVSSAPPHLRTRRIDPDRE